VDNILKAMGHVEDRRRQVEDAEMITTGLVAAIWFADNIEKARCVLQQTRLILIFSFRKKPLVIKRLQACQAAVFVQYLWHSG
jgi:hypothetical protein